MKILFILAMAISSILSTKTLFANNEQVTPCTCEEIKQSWCCREWSFTYNDCPIQCTICIRVNEYGLNEYTVSEMLIPPACSGISLSELQYAAIINALENHTLFPEVETDEWGNNNPCWYEIPDCPGALCQIKIVENVCLRLDKVFNEQGELIYKYFPCDDGKERSCHIVEWFCKENGRVVIEKYPFRTGDPCPPGCIDACDVQH